MDQKKMTPLQKYVAMACVIVIAGSYLLTIFLNNQYKDKLEKLASATMGVPVIIGQVSHSPVSKSLRISDIYIKNPKGFESPYFAHIDDIRLIADQLDTNPAMIENLFINKLEFFYDYSTILGSSNLEFFYHYQQQKFESVQQKGQTPIRVQSVYIASPIISPTDNALTQFSERVHLPLIKINKIGYERDTVITKENAIPYHASLLIQETVRNWTKHKFQQQALQIKTTAQELGGHINKFGQRISNEALDLTHEIDKDIQDVGAFLKEQLNLLTNRTSQQKENAPEKAQ